MKYKYEKHATRAEWLKAREGSIGGSDAASILGLNKFRSPFATWARMTGKTQDDPPTLAMKAGLALEPLMQSELQEQGYHIVTPGPGPCLMRSAEYPWMHYSPDGVLIGVEMQDEGIAEYKKSASLEDWTDEPHAAALAQVQWGLLITGLPKAVIAALIGLGEKMRVYDLLPELELQAVMLEKIEEFRERYILPDQMPPTDWMESTKAALSQMYPKEENTAPELSLDPAEWGADFKKLKEIEDRAAQDELTKAEIHNRLRAAIGTAPGAHVHGFGRATWKSVSRKAYTVKASTYRNLRVYTEKKTWNP